jgi:protoporphyrinogen/coproporphyrinogen III oxidase
MKRICVVGGGISGLTAAFLLKNKGFEIALFDKNAAVGGNIQTVERDGYTIEQGPNSLIKSPRLVDLIKSLRLESEVTAAKLKAKNRYVLQNGRLHVLPMSVWEMVTSDFFSFGAKMRLLREPLVKSKSTEGETVAEFFTRRLGSKIVEKAADPFIAGIFAGKPENLSIKSAFPRLYELEKNYGSLLVGAFLSKSEKADKDFPRTFSFVKGVQALTDKLGEVLGASVRTKTKVKLIEKTADGKFVVETTVGTSVFDAVIVSTPAEFAANLLENLDADLSRKLREIYYPPVVMVFFGVKKESLEKDLDGFGFLIPSSERRKILGTVWNSAVFTDRAPEGFHLLTTFVGGSRDAEIYEQSDEELYATVYAELKEILGLSEPPVFRHIKRWRKAIPQYNVGYDKIETTIENFEAANKGIFFCSNFYKGISVNDCVKNAFQTAAEIESFLKEGN